MNVVVVGATGLVGSIMLKVLEERNFPIKKLIPVASKQSEGQKIKFKNKEYRVTTPEQALLEKPEIALFSAGGAVSLEWAPQFAEIGCTVIDNSSAWRMDKTKKLIVPEINANILTPKDKIIANPNCSTIQMVLALSRLHETYKLKRLVISTYQSITGSGIKAVRQMENERNNRKGEMAYPYPIDKNCLPHCDTFMENGYTKEEMKLVNEHHKILGDDRIGITATAVRVPVLGGHSESVNAEFYSEFELKNIYKLLRETSGVQVLDNPNKNIYPMARFAKGKDDVFVGRIRRDESQAKTLNMWIVADNLRKGAATNAVQIAEYIILKFKKLII